MRPSHQIRCGLMLGLLTASACSTLLGSFDKIDGDGTSAGDSTVSGDSDDGHPVDDATCTIVSGKWFAVGSMAVPRLNHTATVLDDGTVLVVGGNDGANVLASVELYDPHSRTFRTAASLKSPRHFHSAVALDGHHVLVLGGYSVKAGSGTLASAEIFDSSTGTWSDAPAMLEARGEHAAALVSSHRVLVVGGAVLSIGYLRSAEVYDDGTGSNAVPPVATSGPGMSLTLLSDGRLLRVGGWIGVGMSFNTSDLFDPATLAWNAGPPLAAPRAHGHKAMRLPDGRVVVVGGENALPIETFDPATRTWRTTASLPTALTHPTVDSLARGRDHSMSGRFFWGCNAIA